jgi:hypothetical protein
MTDPSRSAYQPRAKGWAIVGAIAASVALAGALASASYPTWAKVGFGLGCGIAWANVFMQFAEPRRIAGDPQATTPLLHRFLGIGLVILAALFFALRTLGLAPELGHDSVTRVMAYTLSGCGAGLAAVALLVFKPRVPDRSSGQSVEQYWSTPEVSTKVVPVWFLLEGAGTLAAVGYFLTGEPVSAGATGVLIVAFWLCGPNVFAKP